MNQNNIVSPEVAELSRHSAHIDGLIARVHAALDGANEERALPLKEAHRVLVAAQTEQSKACARASDGATSMQDAILQRNAAQAEQEAAVAAFNAYLDSGKVEDAELLRHRDAVFCAGQRHDAADRLLKRLQINRGSAVATSKWPGIRARLEQAERETKAIHSAARSFFNGRQDALNAADRHAHSINNIADLGFALLFEQAELEACEARDAAIKKNSTRATSDVSTERIVGVDDLRKLYANRLRAAWNQLNRGKGEQAMAAEIVDLRAKLGEANAKIAAPVVVEPAPKKRAQPQGAA